MKLCINCKHHEVTYDSFDNGTHICYAKAKIRICPIVGTVYRSEFQNCSVQRGIGDPYREDRCGEEGKFYEPWWRFWK
jgi:hypothetical protein